MQSRPPQDNSRPPFADPGEDLRWMRLALAQAEQALEEDEVPVGCVVVHRDTLVAKAHNQVERLADPTAHAEMLAITQATAALGRGRLTGCTLYVTLEPCCMCAGAVVLARLDRVVFGAPDPKFGACGSLWTVPGDPRLNHRPLLAGGVLAETSAEMLKAFFQGRR